MKSQQLSLNMPKEKSEKREKRLIIQLNNTDMMALEACMKFYGETNRSAFVRRVVYDIYRKEKLDKKTMVVADTDRREDK